MENKEEEKKEINSKNKIILNFFSITLLIYFIFGFYNNENSAGAGGYNGDFNSIWNNLLLLKEDIIGNLNNTSYNDSRTPLSYILHIVFNPFTYNQDVFRISILVISFFIPILLFFSLKLNYPLANNHIILAFALIITLSPYFRTTAYWGLSENYGLISLILSYLTFMKLKNNFSKYSDFKNILLVLTLCFISSLTVYFDQKLIFLPLFIFLALQLMGLNFKIKIFSFLFFAIFSIPYLYLIYIWGSFIPTSVAESRQVGSNINLLHPGYCISIIGFYLLPFVLVRENFIKDYKKIFLTKKFLYYILSIILYLFFLFNFSNFENQAIDGKGIFHKLISITIDSKILEFIITLLIILLSSIIVYIFFKENSDILFFLYFLILSIFTFPFYQEYLDPLILILIFTFSKTKIKLNIKNFYIIFVYFLIFSLSTKFYYSNII